MGSQQLALILGVAALFLTKPARAENLQHTQQLLATNACPGCDLSRVGLTFATLVGANLAGANLINANLSRADLSNADLSGADLRNANLFGADLRGANLQGTDLRGADLREAFLSGADLTDAQLGETYMQNVVGMPPTVADSKAGDFHNWGIGEARTGNHQDAIVYYNQALAIDPGFAPTYLGRSISHYGLGNVDGAMVDAQQAVSLFEAQGHDRSRAISQTWIEAMETDQEEVAKARKKRSGVGNFLSGVVQSVTPILFRFLSP